MNIAILEDEYIHTYRLTEIISTILKELNISTYELKTFKKSDSLLNDLFVPSNQNIYFLDLELEGNKQQGLEISKLIRNYDSYASLIFFTSHSELLPLTYRYKVSALDFIAKDSQTLLDDIKEDLKIVLNKRKKIDSDMFNLQVGTKFINIEFDKICFFESHYANSHASLLWLLDNRELQISKNLHEIEREDHRLVRVHRSFLVNLANVEFINRTKKLLHFKNDLVCPISRRKLKNIQEQLLSIPKQE